MALQMEPVRRCEMTARCRRQTNYLQPRLKTPTDSQTKGGGGGGCSELSVLSEAAHTGPWVLCGRTVSAGIPCTPMTRATLLRRAVGLARVSI